MLNPLKVGVRIECLICGQTKKPIGRSEPLGASFCDDDCEGYRQAPLPGSLWPGESEAEFGYQVGDDDTELRAIACARCGNVADGIEFFAPLYRRKELKAGRSDPGLLCGECAGARDGARIGEAVRQQQ